MSTESHRRVAVTGINGFVGKHLTRELADNGIEVVGVGQEDRPHVEIADLVSGYHSADLAEVWPVKSKVDAVVHLAGLAAVGPSFDDPQKYYNLNSAMVTNMAEYYLRAGGASPRLVVVSSGAIYSADQPMALDESSRPGLDSPYAVSKVLVENQCAYYRSRGLDCVVMRPFNHIGPGQNAGFLVPDMIEQLRGADGELKVGNITTKRDYTDVRDVARAYRLVATANELAHATYNICSGKSISGTEIVETLQKLLGKKDVNVTVDPARVRPTDAADVYGSAERLHLDTGWRPEIALDQTLADCSNA